MLEKQCYHLHTWNIPIGAEFNVRKVRLMSQQPTSHSLANLYARGRTLCPSFTV
jgi:hypothetical protein